MKTLIVFYSLEGNTHFIAEILAKELGADTLELKTKKAIPTSTFGKYFWGGKQVFMKESPELVPYGIDPALYDLVIFGSPVWAATYAPAFRTFFSKHVITDKKLAFFCSYAGNAGKTFEHFKQVLPGNIYLGEIGFLNPLKSSAESAKKATEWIRNILKKI